MYKLIIACVLIGLQGCATQPTTLDSPDEEMASVHGTYWGSLRWHKAVITGYDNTDFGLRPVAMVKLIPGQHSISAHCHSGFHSLSGMLGTMGTISFDAEPGHSYKVFCGASGSRMTIWIEDQSDGSVVGGTPP